MAEAKNTFLDAGLSESDNERGYQSEDDYSKTRTKRPRLSSASPDLEEEEAPPVSVIDVPEQPGQELENEKTQNSCSTSQTELEKPSKDQSKFDKKSKPGVVYLSSLPPYLKPSALRNLLSQRGFTPITRLFLAPLSKSKDHHTKKSSRQLYSEGWIEFSSRKIAKRCAEAFNANLVGGPKGGFYHDDLWNMKYLRGLSWDDLMGQVREERREEEVRIGEERRLVKKETRDFVEAVERGKRERGMERKRGRKRKAADDGGDEKRADTVGRDEDGQGRSWMQYKVKQGSGVTGEDGVAPVSEDVKRVLSKIF